METSQFSDADDVLKTSILLQRNDQTALSSFLQTLTSWQRSLITRLVKYDNGKLFCDVVALLQFEGLKYGFKIGRFAPIMDMKCFEVIKMPRRHNSCSRR